MIWMIQSQKLSMANLLQQNLCCNKLLQQFIFKIIKNQTLLQSLIFKIIKNQTLLQQCRNEINIIFAEILT